MRFLLGLGAAGDVRTTTMKALSNVLSLKRSRGNCEPCWSCDADTQLELRFLLLKEKQGRDEAILVFIDGTICDDANGITLGIGTPEFYRREELLKDIAVPGSVSCLQELAQRYEMVYIGARPVFTCRTPKNGWPRWAFHLARSTWERLRQNGWRLSEDLREQFDFMVGIGDRWDDNELHLEIGCLSIILQEHEGNWSSVPKYIARHLHE